VSIVDQGDIVVKSAAAFRRRLATGAVVAVAAFGVQFVAVQAPATAAEIYPAPATGSWVVDGHGLGHGHGLSQYGAQGAALAGLSYTQILSFYYPGTTVVAASAVTLRVLLSGPTTAVTVGYKPGMSLSWSGGSYAIPTGATQWRLVPSGTGLLLQRLVGASWSNARTGLPGQAYFSGGTAAVRFYRTASLSIDYRGTVGAVRNGSGLLPINRVALDDYTRGVIPREMPSSWQPAAVNAQAVAARSYARYAYEHNAAQLYDICDTTSCQVYGGAAQFSNGTSNGIHEEPGSNTAVAATTNRVATYQGHTIFAQFSAADGGWTVDGGQPYLIARADPYEQRAGGPYFAWSRTVATASVASYYGLSRLTQIQITGRDGHGDWGGRVTSAIVTGVNSGGATVSKATSGFALTSAMKLPHNWFKVRTVPPSAPTSVTVTPADHSALLTWQPPTTVGSSPVTGYSVAVSGRARVVVAATARSYWVTGLTNGQAYSVQVSAISTAGEGPQVVKTVTPATTADAIVPVRPLRLFSTGDGYGPLTPTHQLNFGMPGHGSIPTTARSVLVAVTITAATTNGVLNIYPNGAPVPSPASIAYRAGRTTTATIAVSLVPTKMVRFVPSAGSVQVLADQVGYTTGSGPLLSVVPQSQLASIPAVPSSPGMTIPIVGHGGVPSTAVGVVLQVSARSPAVERYLKVWPDGTSEPRIAQVNVLRDNGGSNVVMVPIGASGAIRMDASGPGATANVTVVGYLAPPGQAAAGHEAGHQVTLIPSRVTATPITVTSASTTFPGQAVAGVPFGAAQGLLVQVTVTAANAAGAVRVYPNGDAPLAAPSLLVSPGAPITTTLLVSSGVGGLVRLATDGPTVQCIVEVIGYTAYD